MSEYDAIVVGAGQAGPGVAADVVARGGRVALIEMEQVGGTCLNHGCRPTKALRASGVAAHRARRAAEYGVGTGEVTVDFPAVMERMHTMIDSMREGLQNWLAGDDQIDLFHGIGTLETSPDGLHRVTVDGQTLTSRSIYLDLGARATLPPIPGLDGVPAMTEVELLNLTDLPEHLVIIGGGYIGVEFGQMFRRFGSKVSIVVGDRVAAREDPDVSQTIADMLTDEGIQLINGRAVRVDGTAGDITVTLDDDTSVIGSHLLVATGRRSNADLIGDAGLDQDDRGFITIDSRFATSVPGVWALGDVNGHGAFTHTAYQDSQILLAKDRTVDGRITAYAMFTDPPLGRVGMTETEARASGRTVLKADLPMSSVSRAVLDSETTGLMRILVDADSEEILGATFLGMHGDDLAAQIGQAMQTGVLYPAVRDALPIHPSVSEFIPTLLSSLQPLDA